MRNRGFTLEDRRKHTNYVTLHCNSNWGKSIVWTHSPVFGIKVFPNIQKNLRCVHCIPIAPCKSICMPVIENKRHTISEPGCLPKART